jgi:membrane associated rhomboid family serine protease
MFLPLSDAPNPQRIPFVTYALIAANVLIFLGFNLPLGRQAVNPADPRLLEYVQVLRDQRVPDAVIRQQLSGLTQFDLFVIDHGFRPGKPQIADLFTSMFLHAGFMHLFGNMLFLWIYGDNVEYRLGWLKYLVAYIATGLAATLAFTAMSIGSKVPMIGASGAISGVLGLYFIWFPRNTVRMFVFLMPVFVNVIEIPARIVLGIYLILDNIVPMLFSGMRGEGGVAHGAHIGGFVAGLGLAWGVNRLRQTAAPSGYRPREINRSSAAVSPGASITELLDRGDMPGAARAYFATGAANRGAVNPEDAMRLADWLRGEGKSSAALAVYQRVIRDRPTGQQSADAHVGAGIALLNDGQVAGAYQFLRRALELNPTPQTSERAIAALQQIADRQKYPLRRFVKR